MSEFTDTIRTFQTGDGDEGRYYSLPALEEAGLGAIHRLPVSIRIVLESVLRHCDGEKVTAEDVRNLAGWSATDPSSSEIPFTVARIVLQDFTGVPLLVDLAAMRSAVADRGGDPAVIEPLVPVDLVVDHSVQVDFAGSAEALTRNLDIEFLRNRERYEFLKWGQQAFRTFNVVPPGIGIVHQVNLEHLAQGVLSKDGVHFPDTLVGTDSHTTMINGLGVVGWGVGGIEAEAGMLGQPITFLTPEVVGVNMSGALREGVTATDLALHVTQLLRSHGVVGKFVEFHGEGARSLPLPDRATIANMAPEYGATMGFFPVDGESVRYLESTGRPPGRCQTFRAYFEAQGMFGIPGAGEVDYSDVIDLDLGDVEPSVAGPKRPQDRVALGGLREKFEALFEAPAAEGGYGKDRNDLGLTVPVRMDSPAGHSSVDMPGFDPGSERNEAEMTTNRPSPDAVAVEDPFPAEGLEIELANGSVLIAAITSCTNTSNPSVMLAAGLLARNAVRRGLTVNPFVKTSLAPGSRVVSDYLARSGLQDDLDRLGFQTVGYGCTTCIGNSGPLHPAIERTIREHDLVAASVLSGNRNFEARVHQSIRANYLMSPPLVVAFALAGTVDIDLTSEPLGEDSDGRPVFLKDLWPSLGEIRRTMEESMNPDVFRKLYSDFADQNPKWNEIPSSTGAVYAWSENSTYIQRPPFFEGFDPEPADMRDITGARLLGLFGDSVTTDHISPAGAIKEDSPAGRHLLEHGVEKAQFNSYGSRRGNDRVMTRGTFANVRIKNLMVPGSEGGVTKYYGEDGEAETLSIFDAASRHAENGTPLVVVAGEDYGMGSSRDWAAKGTRLLGVRAVITKSFERIHRSNLIGMGVLPLTFQNPDDYDRLALEGNETLDITGLTNEIAPRSEATLTVRRADGSTDSAPLVVRLDTPAEIAYYRAGGILPYVLARILGKND